MTEVTALRPALRPRRRTSAFAVLAVVGLGSFPLCLWVPERHSEARVQQRAANRAEPVAFVGGATLPSGRNLFSRRHNIGADEDVRDVAMGGVSNRKKRNVKKNAKHPDNLFIYHRKFCNTMPKHWAFQRVEEPCLEKWTNTLKLTFPEGQDDVSEEEIREFFKDYANDIDGVITDITLPHLTTKTAYVHFKENERCIEAKKGLDGQKLGKADEVMLRFTMNKKWERLQAGEPLTNGPRGVWMEAYGRDTRYKWDGNLDTINAARPLDPSQRVRPQGHW